MEEFIASLKEFFIRLFSDTGLSIVKALAVLVVGLIVATVIVNWVKRGTIKNTHLDNSASAFISSLVRIVLYVVVAILVLGIAGVNTASLVAAFSAVALAIALGLQNTLTGLTNGILIIFTKPFKQGDYISVGGAEGTVKEIRLFNTKLVTPDNLDVLVPNSTILNSNLTNYSAMPLRRIDIDVPIPYETDIDEVKKILLDILQADKRIVDIPAPMCRLKSYGDSALMYVVRAWVANGSYWDVRFDLLEGIVKELRAHGIEIPYNQMDIHVIPPQDAAVLKNEKEDK
ncbi:MAG: mechanosensitive ion channel [Clostridia bacterium]|nr:mechanosensitive ion channel [Clostridia bacterium]